MIFWLDQKIFGNGHGLAAPYFDQRYYWLVQADVAGRPGELYTWFGGLGAQLYSMQWTHPVPGERRRLAGEEFVVFNSTRRGPRVLVAWALMHLPNDLDAAHERIRAVRAKLGEN